MPEAPIHTPPDTPAAATSATSEGSTTESAGVEGSSETSEGSSTEPGDKPGGPETLGERC